MYSCGSTPKRLLPECFQIHIATAFVVDLLVVVLAFFVWTHFEARKYGIKNLWLIWVLTLLFGVCRDLPLIFIPPGREKADWTSIT